MTETLTKKVLAGGQITKAEALALYDAPLDALCRGADEIRRAFCGEQFDLCAIVNAKSGRCSENCTFCAQSAHNHTGADCYPLLSADEILPDAQRHHQQGVPRYSLVASGKRLSNAEVDAMCQTVRRIRDEVGCTVCVSFGLLNEEQFRKLKEAGVSRVHNNLETSCRNFPNVCTTHTFAEKVRAIRSAQAAGLEVCSGGILGLGESPEDRIDMALTLRALGIQSVPVNMLNPIPGTPLEANPQLTSQAMQRTLAVYRFLLPRAFLRLAGGRGLLEDKGAGCFQAGANAAITGDMLTTVGITVQTDQTLLKQLGYKVVDPHG